MDTQESISGKSEVSYEAKGKGAMRPQKPGPLHTEADVNASATVVKPLTSYNIFLLCIERAKNLIKLHKAAHGRRSKPEKYMADAHRASIVLAVSALDAFIRTFVIARIRELLANKTTLLSDTLTSQIKAYLKEDGLFQAARHDDLLDRVEKAFQADFDKKSFQGTANISNCMKLIGYDDIFHEVALKAELNEDTFREEIDKFTQRRHIITHKGDYDLNENPPKENMVIKKDAEDCIKIVSTIAKYVNALRQEK
jgi:hypothetical protein